MATLEEQVKAHLAAYDLKPESGGEWRCNSPLRVGANGHSFRVKFDADGGTFYDHNSEERGSIYDLALLLGIVPDLPQVDTPVSYRTLDEYALAHGIPGDRLRAKGWSDAAQYQGRLALAFKTATGVRWRFLDGQKPKYKSELDYKACWYGLNRALELARESGQPLVLCNGEVSTLAAQYHGVAAVCFTGGGEREIPPDLLAEFNQKRGDIRVLIAQDCDAKGRKGAQAQKAQLPDASVIDLGLGDKGDLADYCKLYGSAAITQLRHLQSVSPAQTTESVSVALDVSALASALTQLTAVQRLDAKARAAHDVSLLLAQARTEIERIEAHTSKPLVVSFRDLAAENLKALDWALEHRDAVQGLRSRIPTLDKAIGGFLPELYTVYGATGMGKSWFCVTLAREFIDQGAGLIITTESNPKRWQTRLVAALTKLSADKIETGMLTPDEARRVRQSYDYLASLDCRIVTDGSPTPAQVRVAALDGLSKYAYKWVIVDSASKMHVVGASDIYSTTKGVADGLQSLYTETNLPIICTSQVGRDVSERKSKLPQLEDGYGGGIIEHNAGVVLALYRHGYYVEKGSAPPSDKFPNDMCLVRILKNRWRQNANIHSVQLTFAGGGGFHERQAGGTGDRTHDAAGSVPADD